MESNKSVRVVFLFVSLKVAWFYFIRMVIGLVLYLCL
jgi:hypothetical protein